MNKFLFCLTLGFLVPVVSAPAWAGFQEGADAYGKGDYQTAMSEWLPLAQAGDAQAENAVGALYDHGLGVISDEAEAFRWYSMAADQSYPLAMRNLGTMYATGHGVPYSLQQAQLWLGRAAGAGDQVAVKRLAALPPVGSTANDPIVTPLAATSNSVGTDTTSTGSTSGFGANSGPSSLLAQTSQPDNTQTSGTQAPAAPVTAQAQPVSGTAATTTAPATTATTDSTTPAAPSGQPTFPAKPANTTDTTQTTADQPAANQTSNGQAAGSQTAMVQPATSQPTTSQPATTQSDASQGGTAVAAASDAAPGTVADGWHAFDMGDYKTALTIWQPLAQGGDTNLQVLVGSLYDYGQGVQQDKKQALQWYLLAAQQGSGRGQYAAGALLVKDAKQRNLVEAYKWLTVATDTLKGQGGDIAAGQALSLRQQISKEMSQDDIAKAETLAQGFHAG